METIDECIRVYDGLIAMITQANPKPDRAIEDAIAILQGYRDAIAEENPKWEKIKGYGVAYARMAPPNLKVPEEWGKKQASADAAIRRLLAPTHEQLR